MANDDDLASTWPEAFSTLTLALTSWSAEQDGFKITFNQSFRNGTVSEILMRVF